MSEFKAGEFKRYQAAVGFAVGQLERTLAVGEIVEYDGTRAKFETGETHTMPNFKGCIARGWLQDADKPLQAVRPQSAGIRPRPAIADSATSTQPVTSRYGVERDENQVVSNIDHQGDYRGRAQVGDQTRTASTSPHAETRAGNLVGDFSGVISQEADEMVVSDVNFSSGGAQVKGGDFEGGAGGEIEYTNTSKMASDVRNSEREAQSRLGQKAKGRSVMADMDKDELAAERIAKGLDPDGGDHQYLFDEQEEPSPKKKAARKKVAKKAGKKKSTKKVASNVEVSAEDFEWSIKGHWKTRLKKASEYFDNHEIMFKILMIETPEQSEKIKKAWRKYQSEK